MKRSLAGVLLVLVASFSLAAIDVYQFDTEAQEQRFHVLIEQLRCPKCQNQSISDSDADIARDMRTQVANMIREGRTDDEIVAFFTERYGDFVNYKPPLQPETLLLWLGPAVIFLLGLMLVIMQIRRGRARITNENGSR